jgi:hypothetical protein
MAGFARLPLGRHAIGGIRSVVKNHSVASPPRKRAPLRRRLSLLESTRCSSAAQLRAEFRSPMRAGALAAGGVRSSVERPSGVEAGRRRGETSPASDISRTAPCTSSVVLAPPRLGVVVRGADQPLRVSADELLAELRDPDGRSVVLLARIWEDKITKDLPELRGVPRAGARDRDRARPCRARPAPGGAATTVAEWARAGGCSWS